MGAKIFVGNLHPRTTKSELAQFFSAAGRVASISVPVDRETGEPRGFCFVEFADRESAEAAFSVCDGRELNGQRLRLSWAREGSGAGAARREPGRRDRGPSPDEDESVDLRGSGHLWRGSGAGGDDYGERRRVERRRHGKHGSDRKRRSGTRRVIE